MKRPSFQFYPGDWINDAALRSVSVSARGLWIDMICFMHQGSDYGHLKVNHKVILPPNLARMVGATLPEVEGWLAELESAGVFSKDESGCIYSRRMIKDEKLREIRANGGILGGNPALKQPQKVNPKVGGKVNLTPNLKPTPSSSSSSSSSLKEKFNSLGDLENESVFIEACELVFGTKTMANWGGTWRNHHRECKQTAIAVLRDVCNGVYEGSVASNPGGYANQLWKQWRKK
jgi:hypothetical protein